MMQKSTATLAIIDYTPYHSTLEVIFFISDFSDYSTLQFSRRSSATTLSVLRTVYLVLTSVTMDGGAREFAQGCAIEAKKG